MTDVVQPLRREARLADAPAAAAALLEPMMSQAAGAGAALVSLTLDYGEAVQPDAAVAVEAWVERATRTLVFVHGRIAPQGDGPSLVTGSAVFRRQAGS